MVHSVAYFAGVLQIANVFLAVVAGFIAASLFRVSHRQMLLKPWKTLIIVLILFAIEEIFGALNAFHLMEPSFITHLIPTIMMFLLIYTIDLQTKLNTNEKKCDKK